jgi:hypothetical protein
LLALDLSEKESLVPVSLPRESLDLVCGSHNRITDRFEIRRKPPLGGFLFSIRNRQLRQIFGLKETIACKRREWVPSAKSPATRPISQALAEVARTRRLHEVSAHTCSGA